MTKCDSYHCEEHRGEVRTVRVFGNGAAYGPYHYCEQAVVEDEARGFHVEAAGAGETGT